jgi:hypothetical protein
VKYIYTKAGNPVGFIEGSWVYRIDGKAVGQTKDGHVYRLDGSYVGDLEGDLLINPGNHPGDIDHPADPGWVKAPGNPGRKSSLESLHPDVSQKLFQP